MAGPAGFFKGLTARVLYAMPATAICWSTYEFAKFILSRKSREDYQSSVSTHSTTTKDVLATAVDKVRLEEAKLGLRYVLPTTSAETNFDAESTTTTISSVPPSSPPTNVREPTSIIPRELPSMSGAGVYASLSLNTMHNPSDSGAGRNFDSGCNR